MSDVLGPELHYPHDTRLIELFDQQVAATPDREALIVVRPEGGTDRLTYRALAERAAVASECLARLGIDPGMPVIGRLQRGTQAVVALLAALRVRAAYVPLDVALPQHFVDTVLADIGARVVLSGSVPVPDDIAGHTPRPIPEVALIMYTSGTTSRPKAVLHREAQLCNRMHWMWRDYPWRPGEVASQRSPLGVMPSMWEFLGGLLRGVPTVIIPDAIVKDTRLFVRTLGEHRVSRVTVTPSLLRLMLDEEAELRLTRDYLRTVIIGGEHFSLDLVRRFQAALPDTMLINDYGCTEVNTILHTAWPPAVLRPAELDRMPGSLPIANLRVRLLDEQLRPVTDGTVGELCVEGRALAIGYLERDAETAAKFVDGPGGQRCYRTGDLARRLPDGSVLLLGRTDNQVKINGMRIEPESVEAVLVEHPAVREAVITPQELASGARQLHARLVAENGVRLDLDGLRGLLAERLPSYAVPATYEVVAELPRNGRGKVDRGALLAAGRSGTVDVDTAGRKPRSLRALTDDVRELLARRILEVNPENIDDNRDFHLLGLDSVLSVQFARRLRDRYGVDLDLARLYDLPNLTALCAHLWEQLPRSAAAAPPRLVSTLPRYPAIRDECAGIAVVGYSGRFPQAPDVDALWDLIVNGREAVDVVPAARWDVEQFYDPDPHANGRSISRWGAFLENADGFEPLFFGISPAEAELMDPQQRLCLLEGWHALEHAGYCPDQLGKRSVGVFVGAKRGDYVNHLPRDTGTDHGAALLGNDPALIASRLAYHLDLHGPCLTVDTACSSSLTAVHLARQSLMNGECDLALVGGVCVVTDPHFYVSTSKLGIFSPTGHTRPFDNDADGFVQGEGVVFVVLRRLADALTEADTIHGVVRASALNQDGRTNGLGAPSATAQSALEQGLYQRHQIDPAAIGYVEAHGTGTKVGDPIEVAALTTAFRRFTADRQFCALGSLKANLGHLTAAAGLAGLVKVLLCFRHATVPPLANFRNPNEHLDLADGPFYVPTRVRPWPRPACGPRMAAVSSFGLGGTNAHCVVEEPPAATSSMPARQPGYLVVVSARTEESLRHRIADLVEWLRAPDRDGSHTVRDVSFTLLAGRRQFAARHVLVARNIPELAEALRDCLRSDGRRGDAGAELSALDQEFGQFLVAELGNRDCSEGDYEAKLGVLAELVRRGFHPEPSVLFRAEQPHRIPLPTYPFLVERYWHSGRPAPAAGGRRPARPASESSSGQAVAETVAELLGLSAGQLDRGAELADYGMDSIKAVTLKHRLERRLGVVVPMESIGTSRSVDELVAVLAARSPGVPGLGTDPLVGRFLGGELRLNEATGSELDQLFELVLARTEGMTDEP